MLEITFGEKGELVLSGRFDASQAAKAGAAFDALTGPTLLDLGNLQYIASLGLALLLKTEKRLRARGGAGLTLVNVHPHILEILQYSGLRQAFEIRERSS